MNIISTVNLSPSVVSLLNSLGESVSHLFSINIYLSNLFTVSLFPQKDLWLVSSAALWKISWHYGMVHLKFWFFVPF